MNETIESEKVRLIDGEGVNRGVVPLEEALTLARDVNLDLVEVSPDASPPVCKFMDYGKYKYRAQKRASEARRKQKTIDIKEIKIRPTIERHDYDVKIRSMKRFFEDGDKVKVTLRFRGREMARQDLGADLLRRVRDEMEPVAKVEAEPKMEGHQMVMILAPR